MKRRHYQTRCAELQQQNKIFVGQLGALEKERARLGEEGLAARALLRALCRETARLRFVSGAGGGGTGDETAGAVLVSDEWTLGVEQLLDDCVAQLCGGERPAQKKARRGDKVGGFHDLCNPLAQC